MVKSEEENQKIIDGLMNEREFIRNPSKMEEYLSVYKLNNQEIISLLNKLSDGYIFRWLNYICFKLEDISIKELCQQPLTLEDKTFITSIYHEKTPDICSPTQARGWLPYLLSGFDYQYDIADHYPNSRATLIADIHTDPNYKNVLHFSTGFLEHIIAYVPVWEGYEIPVVGPVFSFYEFLAPNYNRLTDEEWRGILSLWLNGGNLGSHDFSLIQRGFWAENYMVSTSITNSIIYYDEFDYNPPDWF